MGYEQVENIRSFSKFSWQLSSFLQNSIEAPSSSGANTTFVLDGSDTTVNNSTFTTEPTQSKKKPKEVLALRSVFNNDNTDLDSSEDFEPKPSKSKNNKTLEKSGILSYHKKLTQRKGFFGKL